MRYPALTGPIMVIGEDGSLEVMDPADPRLADLIRRHDASNSPADAPLVLPPHPEWTKPTVYLTNWSSHRFPGPGRKFTIMARPRAWEWGMGRVDVLSPVADLLPLMSSALKDRRGGGYVPPSLLRYQEAFNDKMAAALQSGDLAPLHMLATNLKGEHIATIQDGDTLCCACSVSEANAGRCHRAWAAPFLVRAGWRVILDGQEVTL